MWRKALIACMLVMLSNHAFAQWYSRETGQISPDTDDLKSADGFGGWLQLTDQVDRFLHDWNTMSTEQTPYVHTIDTTHRGGEVSALLFYVGCGGGTKVCKAKVDYKILRPDGSVYAEQREIALSDSRVAPAHIVRLSPAIITVRIEKSDPLGVYQILATITEPESGQVMNLKQTFSVEAE